MTVSTAHAMTSSTPDHETTSGSGVGKVVDPRRGLQARARLLQLVEALEISMMATLSVAVRTPMSLTMVSRRLSCLERLPVTARQTGERDLLADPVQH